MIGDRIHMMNSHCHGSKKHLFCFAMFISMLIALFNAADNVQMPHKYSYDSLFVVFEFISLLLILSRVIQSLIYPWRYKSYRHFIKSFINPKRL